MYLTLSRMIETRHEDVGHDKVDQADDAGAETEISDLLEKRLARIHVDEVIQDILVEITVAVIKCWAV